MSIAWKLCISANSSSSIYLNRCLERRKRAAWNEEGVARAQYRYAYVLDKLGDKSEAKKQRASAMKTQGRFLRDYPAYLPITDDDEAVFDQMVSIWAGRFTGKLKQAVLAFPSESDLGRNESDLEPDALDLGPEDSDLGSDTEAVEIPVKV